MCPLYKKFLVNDYSKGKITWVRGLGKFVFYVQNSFMSESSITKLHYIMYAYDVYICMFMWIWMVPLPSFSRWHPSKGEPTRRRTTAASAHTRRSSGRGCWSTTLASTTRRSTPAPCVTSPSATCRCLSNTWPTFITSASPWLPWRFVTRLTEILWFVSVYFGLKPSFPNIESSDWTRKCSWRMPWLLWWRSRVVF